MATEHFGLLSCISMILAQRSLTHVHHLSVQTTLAKSLLGLSHYTCALGLPARSKFGIESVCMRYNIGCLLHIKLKAHVDKYIIMYVAR